MRDVSRLLVRQKARSLVRELYRTTAGFPDSERYGPTSQIRRAGVSVVANIAEGYGQGTQGELERHLRIAAGSLCEVETLLLVSSDLRLITSEVAAAFRGMTNELSRMLVSFAVRVSESRRS